MIILIRHSTVKIEPEKQADTWQLSEEGRVRIRLLAQKLKPYAIQRLISSPQEKAIQTAEAISEEFKIECGIQAGLEEHHRETTHYFQNRAEFLATIQSLFENPDHLVYGEESANQALERFEIALNKCLSDYPNESIGLVTHGTVLALFIAKYNNLDVFAFWQSLEMPMAFVLSLPDYRLQGIVQAVE